MTNNKHQTAVEWFNSKIKQLEFWVETRQITWKEYHKEKDKLLEQAKAMEKQRMIDFTMGITNANRMEATKNAEQWYNETYGGNK